MDFRIKLPKRDGEDDYEILSNLQGLVIIGSNGSGKSRLGRWIKQYANFPNKDNLDIERKVIRISAEKNLYLKSDLGQARKDQDQKNKNIDQVFESASGRKTYLPDDSFDVIILLLLKRANEIAHKYLMESQKHTHKVDLPDNPLDKLKYLWEDIFSNLNLKLNFDPIDQKIEIAKDSKNYTATEMSDGERVAIYLIGSILLAEPNSTILVDEPEVHLNKALQLKLWDNLENLRSDCLFVYMTHDIEFAASRHKAKKIYIREYKDHNSWIWDEIETVESIPDEILLKITGSPLPVLLVEGNLDLQLSRIFYPQYYVISVGGCQNVISITKALHKFHKIKFLHNKKIYGLIDRDHRTDEEITSLKKHGIYVLEFAETENLFWTPEVISYLVHQNDGLKSQDYLAEAINLLMDLLQQNQAELIHQRTMAQIKAGLRLEGLEVSQIDTTLTLINQLTSLAQRIDVDALFKANEVLYQDIQVTRDYSTALKVFPLKEKVSNLAEFLKIKKDRDELPSLVLGYLEHPEGHELVEKLRIYLPKFE